MKLRRMCLVLLAMLLATAAGCGSDGKDGRDGIDGTDGVDGENGQDGTNGQDGQNGTNGADGLDGIDGQDGADLTEPDPEPWNSARPIAKRVHAVHMGAELHFPNATVDYRADPVAGRNWQIHFPQDIRNCQTCHPDGDTSGSWATKPARLPCWGCHDSLAAQSHFKIMTWDPTPEAPWSGDEEESCEVCHGTEGEWAVNKFHGIDAWLSMGEFAPCPEGETDDCGKFFGTIDITSATAAANGTVVVQFTVTDDNGDPYVAYDSAGVSGPNNMSFSIVSLEPSPGASRGYNMWFPYIFTTVTVPDLPPGGPYPFPNPPGTEADMGTRERLSDEPTNAAVFVNNNDGTYSYTFDTNLVGLTEPVTGNAVVYDRSRTHRVSIFAGGHEGLTASDTFDFVPDGSSITETRDIVQTSACHQCHGESEFHGHGGDRLTLEDCNMCHNQFYRSPYNDEFVSMPVMLHKIHAGGAVASIPGPDGIVWDNPDTSVDESADNGEYKIFRARSGSVREYEWWHHEIPSVPENCEKCHTGAGADVDNWKTKPSRDVCGSCHDTINWSTGDNHGGGAQTQDNCSACHPSSGAIVEPLIYPIPAAHDWIARDARATPEFTVELSMTAPLNGTHYEAGEAPLVTIKLWDNAAGAYIDHTTVVEDDAAEGCTEAQGTAVPHTCPDRDGKFTAAYLFVHGPRAKRAPALTTAARASITSTTTGPFDLSASGAALDLLVDDGEAVFINDGTVLLAGAVSIDVEDGTFSNVAAATAAEVVAWLNGDSGFSARAIAYLEGGYVSIRSRNLGKTFAIRLEESAVNTAVFGGDTDVHRSGGGGSYPRNVFYKHDDPAEDDAKVAWFTDRIEYQLDPVDDLTAGTYVVSVEVTDRGRVNGSNYWVPAVDRITFEVGTDEPEPPVAGNCDRCHQSSPGRGFVVDPARHNKMLGDDAIDQCGACHDYQAYRQ